MLVSCYKLSGLGRKELRPEPAHLQYISPALVALGGPVKVVPCSQVPHSPNTVSPAVCRGAGRFLFKPCHWPHPRACRCHWPNPRVCRHRSAAQRVFTTKDTCTSTATVATQNSAITTNVPWSACFYPQIAHNCIRR